MSELRKWTWAALAAAAAAAPAAAQQPAITSTTVPSTGGQPAVTSRTVTGTGGIASGGATGGVPLGGGSSLGGGAAGGGGGLGGGGSGFGSGSSGLQGMQLAPLEAPPTISAPTGAATGALHPSNRFAGYYANPYTQGISTQTNAQPGGFGMPLYGNATTGRGAIGGTGALGAGVGGRIGGLGGQTAANQSGILIPLPSQIAYTARMQFPTPPVAAGKIQTDIRAVLDSTREIANPRAVQILTDADNNVTIRGNVKDDDEARLIEGLVRLTPGVGAIKNELAFPVTVNR